MTPSKRVLKRVKNAVVSGALVRGILCLIPSAAAFSFRSAGY